jgi:cardiolipin synthase
LWLLVSLASGRRRPPPAALVPLLAPRGEQSAALLVRDNLRHRRDIEEAYLAAIAAAQNEVLIANAYFLPGLRFRHALMAAAARGVRVTVVVQGRIEYRLLHYAAQALYGALLSAGVRLVEYRQSFMHAKVAVIDGQWATVGSSNIDPFSLLLAREANLVIRDAAFATELRRSLEAALSEGAVELLPGAWQHRPWPNRLLRWMSYGLVRLLMGMAGMAGRSAE